MTHILPTAALVVLPCINCGQRLDAHCDARFSCLFNPRTCWAPVLDFEQLSNHDLARLENALYKAPVDTHTYTAEYLALVHYRETTDRIRYARARDTTE